MTKSPISGKRLIEIDFPIEGLNDIASREATGGGTKPIYRLHRWWARRPGNVFRAIITLSLLNKLPGKPRFLDRFTTKRREEADWKRDFWGTPQSPGAFYQNYQGTFDDKIILDPFMGGGTTIIEALRLGVKAIGIDISPIAWFTTKVEAELANLDWGDIESAFYQIEQNVASKIKQYYKTYCPKCLAEGRNSEESLIDAMYVFWVKKSRCMRCGQEVLFFSRYLIARGYRAEEKKNIYYCPHCGDIFPALLDARGKVACPNGHSFNPNKSLLSGRGGKSKYTCPNCRVTEKIVEATQRQGILPAEMFAIEYYCPQHGRGFKRIDDHDKLLYEKAVEKWERVKGKYVGKLVPDREIPRGDKTKELHNHGYRYWWEMFNPRQFLCLLTLLDAILPIKNKILQELFLLAFSDMLQSNCMFATYDPVAHRPARLFALHAFWPPQTPLENNVWGITGGRITGAKNFQMAYKKIKEAYEYITQPSEKYPYIYARKGKVMVGDCPSKVMFTSSFEELSDKDGNVMLFASSVEDLSFILDKSVDAVITDPPYYANVQYSELANFFYVWLHKVLKDRYPDEFGHPIILPSDPRQAREIVVNKAIGKGPDFYISMMTLAFQEMYKVLKDDGLLIMTYHHAKPESWEAILTALLESRFHVIATYPVHSENIGSKHSILGRERTEMRMFDTIVVAQKRKEKPKRMSWDQVQRRLYLASEDAIRRVEEFHPALSKGDKMTIVLGKLLQTYSEHYPEIYKNRQRVTVREAVNKAYSLAGEFVEGVGLPEVDRYTLLYITTLINKGRITFDELLKLTQPEGLSIDKLKGYGLVKGLGREFLVRGPLARGQDIAEGKAKVTLAVDAIHYLYYVYTKDKPVDWKLVLQKFDKSNLNALARYLYSKANDKVYDKIRNLLERKIPHLTLKEFM